MRSFNIIVAIDLNNGIGSKGQLPWRLSEDLKRFKDITTKTKDPAKKNLLIMGRKTWESLPQQFRPLPDRLNMVLTRNEGFAVPDGVLTVNGFESAIHLISEDKYLQCVEEVFVIGGQQVYKDAIKYDNCRKLYVTHLLKAFECDTFFPSFTYHFHPTIVSSLHEEASIKFRFVVYTRIS